MSSSNPRTLALYRHSLLPAVVGALTIAVAVYLTHGFLRISASAMEMHRLWSLHGTRHDDLAIRATRMLAPSKNVFVSRDTEGEAARLGASHDEFQAALRVARRDIIRTLAPHEAAPLLVQLTVLTSAVDDVARQSHDVFRLVRDARLDEAAVAMAGIDRSFDRARTAVRATRAHLRVLDQAALDLEQRAFERLRRIGIILMGLIGASFVAMVVHIRRITRRDRLVEELQEREAGTRRLNTVFEDALEGLATLNAMLRFTFVNAAFARSFGMTAEELVGTTAGTLVHEEDGIAFDAAIDVVTRYGRAECELRVVRKDGTPASLHIVLVGRGRETYVFTKDITEQKAAEAARRISEERLELASRATNDVIWEWDVVRHRLWISEALPQRIGVPLSGGDVDGDLWIDVIHPEDRERAVCNAIVAMEGGVQYWTEEYRVRRADGTYAHVFDRAFILRDEQGVARRMIGAMVDVSARKSAEDAIARLVQQNEMILGSMAEGIFGIDADGRTTFVNQAAAELLGWSVEELLGCNIHQLVHHSREDGSPFPWEECPAHAILTGGQASTTSTDVFWRKDGTSVAIEHACRPMRDTSGALAGAVVTFRDITERRAVERMKDEFVSIVSHELRTPLTSIRGALGLLAGGRVGELPDKAKRMLDIAVSNTDRLVRLINDILDIERMESGRVTFQRTFCDAGDLIDDVVEVMRPMAVRAGIELEALPCATPIFADPDRIAQTITNLVANAIKFSDPATRVTVSAREERGKVVFEVADQGRGIPESKLETIFERFQQVDASDSREKGGSGLGLAICRSIVRQHGGEIWVESAIGHGSRFRFTIPRAAITGLPPAPDEQTTAAGDDHRKIRVLLIEDDLDLAGVIGASFERHGVETLHAASGTAAIEMAQRVTPDLIVLDLIVPGVDGFGVVDWLKDHDVLRRAPLVVYSAIETTPSQRERLTLGPTEFLTKSRVTPDEFERRVVHLLGTVVQARGEMSDVA